MVPPARRRANFDTVKYCYYCGRATTGEPLFCNFCGRTYDVKLCPRLHINPRGTFVCSKCGSHELSTPQPRVPLWSHILLFVFTLISGFFLVAVSVGMVIFCFDRFLVSHDRLIGLATTFVFAFLWWGWTEIPFYLRQSIRRWLRRNDRESEKM
jgi:hypothetical protein